MTINRAHKKKQRVVIDSLFLAGWLEYRQSVPQDVDPNVPPVRSVDPPAVGRGADYPFL